MQEVSRSYDQADENARQVVRRTRNVTRRKYTPEEKVRIVIEGIRGEISVSALVQARGNQRRGLLQVAQGLHWRPGKSRLKGDTLREANKAEVDALKRENERLKELVAPAVGGEPGPEKKPRLEPMGKPYVRREAQLKAEVLQIFEEVSSAGQADPPRVADSTLDLLPLEEQVSRQGV